MRTRLIKNYITSLIGLAVIGVGVVGLFKSIISGYEFLIFVFAGVGLIWSKDGKIKELKDSLTKFSR